ncbi:monocarboxylate transporter 12-like isoform X2 [Amblyomma americanum]
MSFSDRCSGFLYVGYMELFQVDRLQAGWPQSISFVVNFSAGLLVSGLQRHVSLSGIALLGSLLAWTGPIGASFAQNISVVTLCMGFIHGLGCGVFFVAISVFLMMYFDRYRGITNGIKNLGGTAASVVFPKLILLVQGFYGFRACLLLYGALAMHLTALGMLTKEPPWSRTIVSSSSSSHTHSREADVDTEEHKKRLNDANAEGSSSSEMAKVNNKERTALHLSLDLRRLFKMPVFYVIVVSGVLGYYTQSIFFATIVDFAKDKGFSLTESANVMLYFGVTETVGRLCLPFAADRGLLRRSTLMALSFTAMAASMVLLERGATLLALTAGASLFAAFFGAAVTVEGVVISDYLGVESLSFVFGFTGAVSVPFFFGNPFVLGFFRDYVGSYDHLYKMLASLYFLIAVMWAPILWNDRYRASPSRTSDSETPEEMIAY